MILKDKSFSLFDIGYLETSKKILEKSNVESYLTQK